jgi:hypothetical protein
VTSRLRSATALLVCGAALFGAAACGVPTGDDTFTAIPPAEVPFGLAATSTTTTTTTTTVPVAPATTTAPSSTTPIRLDPAEIYFLSRGRLQPVVVELPPGFSADQLADILEAGPPPDVGLDSLVKEGLIVSSSEARAVLTIDLDRATFERIPSTQQTEAIAQIVMTMISSLRRVGLVNFTIAGEPISVKKGNNLLSEIGEPLTYEDYVILLVNPGLTPDRASDVVDSDPSADDSSTESTTPARSATITSPGS